MIYTDLLMVALVVMYVVDLSGFTQSWRSGLARLLHVSALRPLPPFDCGRCAVWWSCLIYALVAGEFSLPVVCYAALLSFMEMPAQLLCRALWEKSMNLINKLYE